MIIIPIMYICICNAITERDVRECVRKGCCSMDELSVELGVGTGCGRCRPTANEILNESQSQAAAAAA
jgi:bacterioferritin-associated ferredoxin